MNKNFRVVDSTVTNDVINHLFYCKYCNVKIIGKQKFLIVTLHPVFKKQNSIYPVNLMTHFEGLSLPAYPTLILIFIIGN